VSVCLSVYVCDGYATPALSLSLTHIQTPSPIILIIICMCVCMYVCICMCVCVYVCMCVCMCVCTDPDGEGCVTLSSLTHLFEWFMTRLIPRKVDWAKKSKKIWKKYDSRRRLKMYTMKHPGKIKDLPYNIDVLCVCVCVCDVYIIMMYDV